MGVPRFYRWLVERYPDIVERISPKRLPVFDNLYLDMNGIIHNCSHPSDRDPFDVLSEEEMFENIFKGVDRLFMLTNPKKVLFIAVDGVAPRAKMNQQRQRRFRATRELQELIEQQKKKMGLRYSSQAPPFDSNCITPGTEFMVRLSTALRSYILTRLRENDRWRGVTVVYSGHEVPGEGEHKVMEYLRRRREQPDYDPYETHCLYGLDADLIMLGLATHERHFALIREDVLWRHPRRRKPGSDAPKQAQAAPFQLLFMDRIRNNLDLDFYNPRLPFGYSIDRIVDDFVFICYTMGNDFLPHLPATDIPTGGLDNVMKIYEEMLPSFGGYLTEDGRINLKRLESFCVRMAELEKTEFLRRAMENWRRGGNGIISYTPIIYRPPSTVAPPRPPSPSRATNPKSRDRALDALDQILAEFKQRAGVVDPGPLKSTDPPPLRPGDISLTPPSPSSSSTRPRPPRSRTPPPRIPSTPSPTTASSTSPPYRRRNSWSGGRPQSPTTPFSSDGSEPPPAKLAQEMGWIEPDEVWKSRYYSQKLRFGMVPGISSQKQVDYLVRTYVEGLTWMLHYYYHGIASWKWFFPFHYAPLASDICNIAHLTFQFDLGDPFLPFQQLLGVLPPASSTLLPEAYRHLMESPSSPIADFYHTTFEVDSEGRTPWEGIALLPFIEESRLIAATKSVSETVLKESEKMRNTFDREYVFKYGLDNEWNFFP